MEPINYKEYPGSFEITGNFTKKGVSFANAFIETKVRDAPEEYPKRASTIIRYMDIVSQKEVGRYVKEYDWEGFQKTLKKALESHNNLVRRITEHLQNYDSLDESILNTE